MPAVSKVQRRAAAIAKHHPDQLYARNKGLASMSLYALSKMASTSERGVPKRVTRRKR